MREKIVFAKRLRKEMTHAEILLWNRLKKRALGFLFRRQAIVLGWIVDFYCPASGLTVEVDGSIHDRPDISMNDKRKDIAIYNRGLDILRFSNDDVVNHLEEVLWIIKKTIQIRRSRKG